MKRWTDLRVLSTMCCMIYNTDKSICKYSSRILQFSWICNHPVQGTSERKYVRESTIISNRYQRLLSKCTLFLAKNCVQIHGLCQILRLQISQPLALPKCAYENVVQCHYVSSQCRWRKTDEDSTGKNMYNVNIEACSCHHFIMAGKNCYILWVCVFSLSSPARSTHVPYYIVTDKPVSSKINNVCWIYSSKN
jgi:hypothetical protein